MVRQLLLQRKLKIRSDFIRKISFTRFTDPWEQCKFNDLYQFASEGGTPNTQTSEYYSDGTIPFVKIEETNDKYIDDADSYITQAGIANSSAWIVPKNSVIFSNGATVGNVSINRIPVATKQGIIGIIPKLNIEHELLYYLLSGKKFQTEVNKRVAKGTFSTIILKNLNEIGVKITKTSEQEKISNLLGRLDQLITLHQREDKLRRNYEEKIIL